jgi:hypothetical protein
MSETITSSLWAASRLRMCSSNAVAPGRSMGSPREELVEVVARAGQAEEVEVSPEPRDDGVVVAGSAVSLLGPGRVAPDSASARSTNRLTSLRDSGYLGAEGGA